MPILSWLTRDEDLKAARQAPYRLLEEDADLAYGDRSAGNLLVQGDNLEALKALLPFYAGRVKCIYIDPPYNTRSAFDHYDDNLEHSRWLAMMWPRLELLRELLSEDGSIWVSIDDNEGHYLKIIMDEVFGRSNFVANVVWEKSDSPKMDSTYFSSRHDHIHVFAKSIEKFKLARIEEPTPAHYDKVLPDGRAYYLKPLRAMGNGDDTRAARPTMFFPIEAPDGQPVFPLKPDGAEGRWRWGPDKVAAESGRIEWVKGRSGWSPYYQIIDDGRLGRPPETLLPHQLVGSNRTSKAEVKAVLDTDVTFTTPKPEGLVRHIFSLATVPGDLVLDSFLGSGTTAAVAHKMGRRYIGIEVGDHAVTLCAPRLRKVIDGEQGGVSKALEWKGGGGFRFYRLGKPVFAADGSLSLGIAFGNLAAHIWFAETGQAPTGELAGPVLGVDHERAIALLYNGVLGDQRPLGGNVLTRQTLALIREHLPSEFAGELVIYGECSALSPPSLVRERIVFRQTPYDVKARR